MPTDCVKSENIQNLVIFKLPLKWNVMSCGRNAMLVLKLFCSGKTLKKYKLAKQGLQILLRETGSGGEPLLA